jgi:coenzyme PQQ biosynthesis protein PqqD
VPRRAIELTFVPTLARKARLRFDRHSGGHMIIYPERGLALNESAAAIAKLCDGTRTVAAIVEELATEAGLAATESDDIERDVIAFVEQLAKKGLLEP